MYNPFKENKEDNDTNLELIRQSLEGHREGLETLIGRHQAWIFNIAYQMTSDVYDAEDVTQEILIKILTKLSTYDSQKSAFRTWLYRITANHVINMKKRKNENYPLDIDDMGKSINQIIKGSNKQPMPNPESKILMDESKSICLNGMLLCLDRRHRLGFILGGIYGVSAAVGSEILETSEANFRKILSRSREKVNNFFNNKCGLLNESNPCRCALFLKVLTDNGLIDQTKLAQYDRHYEPISSVVQNEGKHLDPPYQGLFNKLYGSEPFLEPPDQMTWIRETIRSHEFKTVFRL